MLLLENWLPALRCAQTTEKSFEYEMSHDPQKSESRGEKFDFSEEKVEFPNRFVVLCTIHAQELFCLERKLNFHDRVTSSESVITFNSIQTNFTDANKKK